MEPEYTMKDHKDPKMFNMVDQVSPSEQYQLHNAGTILMVVQAQTPVQPKEISATSSAYVFV